jgi:arylsulfatase A-like enzyme
MIETCVTLLYKPAAMSRIHELKPNHLLFFLFIFCFYVVNAQKKTTRPNIIYMMADDLGFADLSCYGRKDYKTPNLDKLASEGMRFNNAYATAPVCTPTRVAFMTGRYPARLKVGLYEPIAEGSKDSLVGLSSSIPSVARLMHTAGYETLLIGKWHLGYKPEFSPMANGFDYFFGFHAGATDYISHKSQTGADDLYENDQLIHKEGYITDLFSDKAVELIKSKHKKPFFLALTFNAPHWPWQARGDKPYPDTLSWVKGGSKQTYAKMMEALDDAVGNILKALDDAGIAKETVVIFTSDNGGERYSDNGMYKGGKMNLWEGGIREPAFIRWPEKIKPNTSTEQVVATMDWTATILALGMAKADPRFPLDGMNIMPIVLGQKKPVDRTLYWRVFQRNQNKAMRDGKWKYLQDEKENEYLFDLEADPAENKNVKEQYKDVFEKLKKKYQQWEATMLKPIPLGA